MSKFTFHTNPMSRGQIVRWALHEVDADYDTQIIDYGPRTPEYLAINPMGKVPALTHHDGGVDRVVTECPAICHYLAETHPAAGLLPQASERADYFRWLFFAAGPLEQAITVRSMGWEVSEDNERTTGFGSFDRTMDALDGWLGSHDFICGGRFTMADVYVGSHVVWGMQFGSMVERDSFKAYAARVSDRAAYRAAKAIDEKLIAEGQANS